MTRPPGRDAVELPQRRRGVGDVADAEGDGNDVGGLIGEGRDWASPLIHWTAGWTLRCTPGSFGRW